MSKNGTTVGIEDNFFVIPTDTIADMINAIILVANEDKPKVPDDIDENIFGSIENSYQIV
jgi:hypothetical protein